MPPPLNEFLRCATVWTGYWHEGMAFHLQFADGMCNVEH